MGKKFNTLVLPYLLWGAVYGALLWTPLWMTTNTINHLPLFSNTFLGEITWWRSLDKVVGVVRAGPANPVLWFIRVLIIVFATFPLWVWIRRKALWLFCGLSIFGVFFFTPVSWPWPYETLCSFGGYPLHFKVQGMAWFCLGMCVNAFNVEVRRVPIWMMIASAVLWGVAVCCRWIHVFPVFEVIFAWGLSQRMLRWLPKNFPEWMTMTFWIYCMHGPIAGWVGGVVRAVLGKSVAVYLGQVVLLPVVVMAICIGSAMLVQKYAPKLYAILSGGR